MATNTVALVCPVHKPKFPLFSRFVESYKNVRPDCDLFFVLSEDERPLLNEYKAVWDENEYLFAPRCDPNPSVITYKKFLGLDNLRHTGCYKGIAAIDADSEFVRDGFHASFERFESEKSICGYPLEYLDQDPFHEVVSMSASYFPSSQQLEEYRGVYAWWNTLPWYVSDHLSPFLKSVGFFEHSFANQSWYAYDQTVYHAWLASEGMVKVDNRNILLEYPEMMRTKDLDNFAAHKLDWVRFSARRMPIFKGQSPLMHFHTDRE